MYAEKRNFDVEARKPKSVDTDELSAWNLCCDSNVRIINVSSEILPDLAGVTSVLGPRKPSSSAFPSSAEESHAGNSMWIAGRSPQFFTVEMPSKLLVSAQYIGWTVPNPSARTNPSLVVISIGSFQNRRLAPMLRLRQKHTTHKAHHYALWRLSDSTKEWIYNECSGSGVAHVRFEVYETTGGSDTHIVIRQFLLLPEATSSSFTYLSNAEELHTGEDSGSHISSLASAMLEGLARDLAHSRRTTIASTGSEGTDPPLSTHLQEGLIPYKSLQKEKTPLRRTEEKTTLCLWCGKHSQTRMVPSERNALNPAHHSLLPASPHAYCGPVHVHNQRSLDWHEPSKPQAPFAQTGPHVLSHPLQTDPTPPPPSSLSFGNTEPPPIECSLKKNLDVLFAQDAISPIPHVVDTRDRNGRFTVCAAISSSAADPCTRPIREESRMLVHSLHRLVETLQAQSVELQEWLVLHGPPRA